METKENGYYDIDLELELDEASGLLTDIFMVKDLRQRKLFLNADINQWNVEDTVKHILQFNKEDKGKPVEERQPIILYVTSNGGSVDAGFEVIDAICASKTPVYTINLGFQYSMGFLIGIAGHKRFAMKNARFLMHDGSSFAWDSSAKLQDQMEFQRRAEQRIKGYILTHSKVTEKEYEDKYRVEWYMFADEAKEKGFVDYIIGEDCDIDEII